LNVPIELAAIVGGKGMKAMKAASIISNKIIVRIILIVSIPILFVFTIQNACGAGFLLRILAQTSVKITHPIFDDKLRNDWYDGSVKCKIDPKYDQWIFNGMYGLGATLEKGGALVFKRSEPIDIRPFTGIAGCINGGKTGKQVIGICMLDHIGRRIPRNTFLDVKNYIDGGCLPVDEWKLFAVPFKDLGLATRGITGICFVNTAGEDIDTFYLDEFGLINSPVPKLQKTTKSSSKLVDARPTRASYVFKDKVEGGWQNWSWGNCKSQLYFNSTASGKTSLIVSQPAGSALAFGRHKPFSTAGYEFLEFSVNGGNTDDQKLRVVLFDASGTEIPKGSIRLNGDEYIDGGSLSINSWKKVRIPLRKLRANNAKITKIAIMNNSPTSQVFFIDEIMFIK